MARAGLGDRWRCLFANDSDSAKSEVYVGNWGEGVMSPKDVGEVALGELQGDADLIWASFPCQDLSLAGSGAGLAGSKSGAFWTFWTLVQKLNADDRAPKIIALENVMGAVTSHGGRDFRALCGALASEGYTIGALSLDASHFLPQSRKRLFLVGVRGDLEIPDSLLSDEPIAFSTTQSIISAHAQLPGQIARNWVWWNANKVDVVAPSLPELLGSIDDDAEWNTQEKTEYLISLMNENNYAKVLRAMEVGREVVGTVYKRMRPAQGAANVQRAEVRFDGIAGCLRVPIGGSSKQTLLFVRGTEVKSRFISPRESARLMGLDDSYVLPNNERDAYHLTGDGVAVPVVSYMRDAIFEPLLNAPRVLTEPKILGIEAAVHAKMAHPTEVAAE